MGKDKSEKKASREKALQLQQEKFDALRAAMTPEQRAKADKKAKRFKVILLSILGLFVLTVVLAMFSDSSTTDSNPSTTTNSDNSGVNWSNYAPAVKTQIEELVNTNDCAGLQAEFDIADQNDTAQRNRVGVGNADLMAYIDGEMRRLGCY
jgi:hypothetical protein